MFALQVTCSHSRLTQIHRDYALDASRWTSETGGHVIHDCVLLLLHFADPRLSPMVTPIWGGDLPQLQCWWQRLLHVGVQEPPVSHATSTLNSDTKSEQSSPLQKAQDNACASDLTCQPEKPNLPCMRAKMWHTSCCLRRFVGHQKHHLPFNCPSQYR